MHILDATQDTGFGAALEAALLKDLYAASEQGINSRVDLAINGPDDALVAGLWGTTSYGWLRVNMIWVSQPYRRDGLGQKLMEQAFEVAQSRGCHSCWLETSNPSAYAFYTSLKFEVFGTLRNEADRAPERHARWFLRRTLVGPTPSPEQS